MNISSEQVVYVTEGSQDWVGILKSYYPTEGTCEVELYKEKVLKVNSRNVYLIEKLTPIKDILI